MIPRRRALLALVLPLLLAGCGGDEKPDGPSATVPKSTTTESTTTTTAAPKTPEEEVEAAYLKSWDVYAKALRQLNTEGLEEAYAGAQLDKTRSAVEQEIASGIPVRVDVEHDYTIDLLAPDLAIVRDRYRNHSVSLDPDSGEPTEAAPDTPYLETTTLRKEADGRWKVVDIVRAAAGE